MIPCVLCWHTASAEKCYWQIFQKPNALCPSEVVERFPVATEERLLEQLIVDIITTISNKLRVKRKLTSEAEEDEAYTGLGESLPWTKIDVINTAKENITEEFSGS